MPKNTLPHDVMVIQRITSCHKKCMTTRVITLSRAFVTSLSAMRFFIEIMLILKEIKSHFKGSYDKQNLTFAKNSFH